MGEAITGDGEGMGRNRKGIGIHPTRGPLQLFSSGCVYAIYRPTPTTVYCYRPISVYLMLCRQSSKTAKLPVASVPSPRAAPCESLWVYRPQGKSGHVPPQKCHFPRRIPGPDLIRGSFGHPESWIYISSTSQSAQPFCRPTDTHTDHATPPEQ